jgi:uncharacterized iron-regulated membrane protein
MTVTSSLARWQWIHKWSSLVCTGFLLVICLTGLPLIFSEEIDHLTNPTAYAVLPAGTPNRSLDDLTARARALYPGQAVVSVFVDDDEPQTYVWMAPSFAALAADPHVQHFVRFDSRTGTVLEQQQAPGSQRKTFMQIMLGLHMDLFVDLPGELFLGAMGLLFVAAIVSGVVLYGPFTRKLDFGVVRDGRSRRLRWLDIHNLLGVVTLAWALVVGATGVMNELSTPLFAIWQRTDVATMLARYQGAPPPQARELIPVQAALDTAVQAVPGMIVTSAIYPGSRFGSPYHYLFWAHGRSALTAHMFNPVLVDARSGHLTAVVSMPWYLRALELSRPLHFGNYGGMPLKVLWALLDLVTIVVLGSGLYLWLARGRRRAAPAVSPALVLEPAE